MRHVVVGTAGHIDHGKTSLVKALTGIDCDRLPEEQARGITIDLGFAFWAPTPELRVGVVDVPGHERFVKSMVAGTGGIDLVLLVVAADEGVMPQTREHLDICRLLGVTRGLVVLTKVDLVDAAWLDLVREEIRGFVAGTFLEGRPVVEFSALVGRGHDDLTTALTALAGEVTPRLSGGPPRLPIDRVFTMAGFGTVVTGTLLSGRLRQGDSVEALPSGVRAKVRGLHAYGGEIEEAHAGMRTAVNLQGSERARWQRGDVLTTPLALVPTTRFDADVTYLGHARRRLRDRTEVLCHVGTAQARAVVHLIGRDALEPGETSPAQLRLDRPIAALPGDRFILRGFEASQHHGRTAGGGLILDAHPPRHRRRDHSGAAETLSILRAGTLGERVLALLLRAGHAGLTAAELTGRLPVSEKEVERVLGDLLSRKEALRFDRERGLTVHAQVAADLRGKALALLTEHHAAHQEMAGIPREELRARLSPDLDGKLFALVLQQLEGSVHVGDDAVRAAGHAPELGGIARRLELRARDRYQAAGVAALTTKELAAELNTPLAEVAQVSRFLAERGELIKVKDDLYANRAAIDSLRQRLVALLTEKGEIATSDFKELTGLSRKYVIPLQEYFDDAKVTLRVGDKRILRVKGGALT